MTRPARYLTDERGMREQQRADERAADGIGRGPVRRVVRCKPALEDRQGSRCERPARAACHFDTKALRLEMTIADQRVRKGDRIINRPSVAMVPDDLPRECPDLGGADIVEAEIDRPAEVAAGIERSGRTREPREP